MKIIEYKPGGNTEILRSDTSLVRGEVDKAVADIITNVRTKGDKALREYTSTFDKASISSFRVTDDEIENAFYRTDKNFVRILTSACENIKSFHAPQKREGYSIKKDNGIKMGQRIIPLESVGLYVPGGTARLYSTLLMSAIPAVIAGVDRIVMVTPPLPDGTVPDAILAAAKIAGVTEIYKVGGAQAVAALAYGTETINKVDKIVGPGNIYVDTAKRIVFGAVDIDMTAGPSEIMIIADDSADASYVAADMLSQAEHDVLASSLLLTTSRTNAEKVAGEIEKQLETLPRRDIAEKSLEASGRIILVPDVDTALMLANIYAPEHLELCVENPFEALEKVRNAGCVFLGSYTPEPLGDYFAGPNHILPTSGSARFFSPLGVDDFVKRSNYLYYEMNSLSEACADVASFARKEGLEAHARGIEIRSKQQGDAR